MPVDETGLIWAVGEPVEQTPDPARAARLQDMQNRLTEVRKNNPAAGWEDIRHSPGELEQWARDLAEERRPPVRAPDGFAAAAHQLLDLSLLAPVRLADDDEERFFIHRWTAGALAQRSNERDENEAHRAAAEYWLWRVAKIPQSRQTDIADLLEARHHLRTSGDLARFYAVSGDIFLQLQTWGAWEWEERLIRETLAAMPKGRTR